MDSAAFPAMPTLDAAAQAPLKVLYACHRRILRRCDTFRRLVLCAAECGPTRDAQVASHGLLGFFDNEVPRHCADEEGALFPALIESMAGSDAVCLQELTRGAARQHRALAVQWNVLRLPVEEIAMGLPTLLPAHDVEAFARLWYDHIAFEESELLPMAARLLADEELAQVGRRMQASR